VDTAWGGGCASEGASTTELRHLGFGVLTELRACKSNHYGQPVKAEPAPGALKKLTFIDWGAWA
jgi:hypothetical protein